MAKEGGGGVKDDGDEALDVGGRSVWLFLPGTLGAHTSFISELSPVFVQCEWGYIWHTAGRGANGLSSVKQKAKKKVVMKSSHSQVDSVFAGEDERDLNLGVISRCFSSRSSVAWQGQVSHDPGFCFGEGGL